MEAGAEAGCKFTLPIFTVLMRALAAAHDVVPASGQIDDALTNAGVAVRQQQLAELIADVESLRRNMQGAASQDVVCVSACLWALCVTVVAVECRLVATCMVADGRALRGESNVRCHKPADTKLTSLEPSQPLERLIGAGLQLDGCGQAVFRRQICAWPTIWLLRDFVKQSSTSHWHMGTVLVDVAGPAGNALNFFWKCNTRSPLSASAKRIR